VDRSCPFRVRLLGVHPHLCCTAPRFAYAVDDIDGKDR